MYGGKREIDGYLIYHQIKTLSFPIFSSSLLFLPFSFPTFHPTKLKSLLESFFTNTTKSLSKKFNYNNELLRNERTPVGKEWCEE